MTVVDRIVREISRSIKKDMISLYGVGHIRWLYRRRRIVRLFSSQVRARVYQWSPRFLKKRLVNWWHTPQAEYIYAPFIPLIIEPMLGTSDS